MEVNPHYTVMPAQAGIHTIVEQGPDSVWTPAFAGVTIWRDRHAR